MEGSRVQHTRWEGGAQGSVGGGCQVTQAPYLSAPPQATHRRDHSHASHTCANPHTRMPRPTHVDTQLGRQSTPAHTLSWTRAHSWIPAQHTQTCSGIHIGPRRHTLRCARTHVDTRLVMRTCVHSHTPRQSRGTPRHHTHTHTHRTLSGPPTETHDHTNHTRAHVHRRSHSEAHGYAYPLT